QTGAHRKKLKPSLSTGYTKLFRKSKKAMGTTLRLLLKPSQPIMDTSLVNYLRPLTVKQLKFIMRILTLLGVSGTNECQYCLIRLFIPKGKSMDNLYETLVAYVENWCNTLSRKLLCYRTSEDVFRGEMQTDGVA